jgi:hypothetical protein
MPEFSFNASDHPDEYTPIPKGQYQLAVTNSVFKPTKSGTGKYLELEFTVIDGIQSNRKFFLKYNIVNENEQAVHIGKQQLAKVCEAVNKIQFDRTEEIHNIPFHANITVKAGNNGYSDYNEISSCKSLRAPQEQDSPPPQESSNIPPLQDGPPP